MVNLKLTDKLCDEICNDIKAGVPIKHAVISHGISETTYYRWYDKGKEAKSGKFKNFYDKIQEAKSVAVTLRARRVYKAGETSWQADAWWLERVDPENFGRKDTHKVDMKTDQNVKQDITEHKTIYKLQEENKEYLKQIFRELHEEQEK